MLTGADVVAEYSTPQRITPYNDYQDQFHQGSG